MSTTESLAAFGLRAAISWANLSRSACPRRACGKSLGVKPHELGHGAMTNQLAQLFDESVGQPLDGLAIVNIFAVNPTHLQPAASDQGDDFQQVAAYD